MSHDVATQTGGVFACEDCAWQWPLHGSPPVGAECDACGGELIAHGYLEGPDPICYGCRGTGFLRWARVAEGVRCSCVDSCSRHERVCVREDA